jgi:hypothetical protein
VGGLAEVGVAAQRDKLELDLYRAVRLATSGAIPADHSAQVWQAGFFALPRTTENRTYKIPITLAQRASV